MKVRNAIFILVATLSMVFTTSSAANSRSLLISTTGITSYINDDPKGETIVKTALQYLGTKYRSGRSGPGGFDCSGLTSYVYKLNNVHLTRSSRSQFTEGTPIMSISNLRKGDLVFFGGSRGSNSVGHVGIVTDVADNGQSFKFVHAARTGVQVDSSNQAYYSKRYMGARRIIDQK